MPEKFDDITVLSISELGRQFSDATIMMHEAIARKVGLSGTDHKYLGMLIQNGEMTAGELSFQTGLTTGATTGLIDRLEKKKLVRRHYDKTDRRKVLIVPDTERAMKLLGGIFADLQNKILDLFSTYNNTEIDLIKKYLISTIALMKETADELNDKKGNKTNK